VVAAVEAEQLAEARRPEHADAPPASRSRSMSSDGQRMPPKPSSSTRTCTPAEARATRASNIRSLTRPGSQM
jgi:hypothetical protein